MYALHFSLRFLPSKTSSVVEPGCSRCWRPWQALCARRTTAEQKLPRNVDINRSPMCLAMPSERPEMKLWNTELAQSKITVLNMSMIPSLGESLKYKGRWNLVFAVNHYSLKYQYGNCPFSISNIFSKYPYVYSLRKLDGDYEGIAIVVVCTIPQFSPVLTR